MRPVNVAVIGYGLAGRVFHSPLIAATEGLHLAAVVSSRAGEIAASDPGVAAVVEPQAVFDDPEIDLVVVATPNDSHFDLAARALAAGKHVVIDKPFALTSTEAQSLIDKARGRLLTVFHNRRWDGDFLTVKKLVGNGTLGDVAYMESHFDVYRPAVRDRWRERTGPATGTWYDLGSHLLDQALQLFGIPLAVTADLAARRPGAKTTDYFHVLLRYNNIRVVLCGNSLAPTDIRFVLHGSKSSLIMHGLDPQETQLSAGLRPGDRAFGVADRPAKLVLAAGNDASVAIERGAYGAFYAGVRDALHGTAPLPVTAREALAVMQILEAAEMSAKSGREVRLTD